MKASGLQLAAVWIAVMPGFAAARQQPAVTQDAQSQPIVDLTTPPSTGRQQEVLTRIQQYAVEYVSNLPNFVCSQTTNQFEAGKKSRHWKRSDSLTFKLTYYAGREDRALVLVNGKPPSNRTALWRNPLETEGEFALLIASVFDSASQASVSWSRWDNVQDKRVAVFDYAIDRDHTPLRLTLSDIAHSVIPYHGSIYADPDTGAIWRITSTATEIPPELQTESVATTIDYAELAIGAKHYLLPVNATVLMETLSRKVRNQIEFADYRKFEAESTITYTTGLSTGTPASAGSAKAPEAHE